MMQNTPRSLRFHARIPDNMHKGYIFAEPARDAAKCGEFARAVGCDEGADAVDAGVTVRGVGGIEFVGGAFPEEAGFGD